MFLQQVLYEPAMAIVILGIFLTIVVPLVFAWAFLKILEPPETEPDEEEPDHGGAGV